MPVVSHLKLGGTKHGDSSFDHLPSGLLQYALHRPTLGEYTLLLQLFQNVTNNYGHMLTYPCYIFAMSAALAPTMFQSGIHGAGRHL